MAVKTKISWMSVAFLLGGVGALMGCAAGGSVPTVAPTTPAAATPAPVLSRLYEPNYRDALGVGRQWLQLTLRYRVIPTAGIDLEAGFQTALASWQPYTSEFFTFAPTTGSDFVLEVETVPTGSLGGDTIGSTTVTFQRSDSKIVRARISVEESLGADLLPQVLAHELGHALGLDGHSPETGDLMFPRAHLPLVVTERDRNTLFAVYADKLSEASRFEPPPSKDSELVTAVVCSFHRASLR